MRKIILFIGFLCLLPWIPVRALAQSLENVSEQRIAEYAGYYQDSVSMRATLFTGQIQELVAPHQESLYLRERGFRQLDSWGNETYPEVIPTLESYSAGTLVYDGIRYTDVLMRLDLLRDELVVLSPPGVNGIILEPNRVEYAEFHGYRVFYIPPGSSVLPSGYYAETYSEGIRVWKKESYEYHLSERSFINRSVKYYIEKEGEVFRVKNRKGSVLRVLANHRRELDQYIRQYNINFRQNMEASITVLAAEYDRLNP